MQANRIYRRQAAFTLIEILVVMVIITTLAGLGFVVGNKMLKKAEGTKAKNHATSMITSIEGFALDHNGTLPIPESGTQETEDGDIKFDTSANNNFIAILVNREGGDSAEKFNQKGSVYLSAEDVTKPQGGLFVENGKVALFDPWGKPYEIIIDANSDNAVQNPHKKGHTVQKRAIIFSHGPDGKSGTAETNQDNVYSF